MAEQAEIDEVETHRIQAFLRITRNQDLNIADCGEKNELYFRQIRKLAKSASFGESRGHALRQPREFDRNSGRCAAAPLPSG